MTFRSKTSLFNRTPLAHVPHVVPLMVNSETQAGVTTNVEIGKALVVLCWQPVPQSIAVVLMFGELAQRLISATDW